MMTIKAADAEDIRSKAHIGGKMMTIKAAGAEDIRSKAHIEGK